MSKYTNKLQQKPTEYQEFLNDIDKVTRQWAVMSQQENVNNVLEQENDSL